MSTSGPIVGAVVNTTSGLIKGRANAAYPDLSEYLGVPFAQPPIGPLRFAPPQPYQPNSGAEVYIADQLPLSCIQAPSVVNTSQPANWQSISNINAQYANHTSEDCLYLNIWTKVPHTNSAPKPVLLWIYGGGFHSGSGSDLSSDGALWANEQDVVIVHLSYCLNIFGFPGIPGQTQNVALLDQRLAAEWVRDNIAAFGGDPSRITLFGHSAGGTSVSLYSFIWLEDPIVNALIPESGTADSSGNRFLSTTAARWNEASTFLGCGNASTDSAASILACMRTKPAEDIFEASQKASKIVTQTLPPAGQALAGITGIFGPTVDNQTVFQNYSIQGEAGKFMRRPLFTGNNIDEGCFFAEEGQIPISEEAVLTETIFTCPIDREARWFAQANVPTWKYRFYAGYPNVNSPDCPGQPWHGSDPDVMWGNVPNITGQADTQQEIDMGRYMRQIWTAFASDPVNGLTQRFGWPQFSTNVNNDFAIALGLNGTLGTMVNVQEIDVPCLTTYRGGAPNF